MISLEGLTLLPGREGEARRILRTFAGAMRDGSSPTSSPTALRGRLPHRDATLWFSTPSTATARDGRPPRRCAPAAVAARQRRAPPRRHPLRICVDASTGCCGRERRATSSPGWTPRSTSGWSPRGAARRSDQRPRYNALRRSTAGVQRRARRPSCRWRRWRRWRGARSTCASGTRRRAPLRSRRLRGRRRRPALRPNQLFAFSLAHPVLDETRWRRCSTSSSASADAWRPTFARRNHPDYEPKYFGDLRARDAAYHQGTVWSWLIGPFLDCWRRVHPGEEAKARGLLDGLVAHLDEACLGSVSEVFDAEAPFTPRGCIAQAWGVAELLRCWAMTAGTEAARAASERTEQPKRPKCRTDRARDTGDLKQHGAVAVRVSARSVADAQPYFSAAPSGVSRRPAVPPAAAAAAAAASARPAARPDRR